MVGANRRTRDKAAATLAHHNAAKSAQEQERTAQIEVDDPVIFLVCIIQHQFSDVDCRCTHRNVEPLVLAIDRCCKGMNGLGVAGINDVRFGTASRSYFGSGTFYAHLILVGANHRGAERCQ